MAMSCGHFEPDKETKKARVESGQCPVCPDQSLTPHIQVLPHGYCDCCKECWVLFKREDDAEPRVRVVIHAGY